MYGRVSSVIVSFKRTRFILYFTKFTIIFRSEAITRVQPKEKSHVVFSSELTSDDANTLTLSNGGRTTWPNEPNQNDKAKMPLVLKALSNREVDKPLLLNVGGKRYEVKKTHLIEKQ